MLRVPVLSRSGKPLMPTKASRARRWLKEGKAKIVHNDLECFAIQLTFETGENTQSIAIGIDPGKCYSGIGVQTKLQVNHRKSKIRRASKISENNS